MNNQDKTNITLTDIDIQNSNNIMNDISQIIETSQKTAYKAIDIILLKRNWLIGKRICEEELKETRKENYGLKIINMLSIRLTEKYGKGFDKINLYYFRRFYTLYKKIFYTVCEQSLLSWSHYRLLLRVEDSKARAWYEKEAANYSWSVRTLQRNIETQYYYRLMASPSKEGVIKEMEEKTKDYQLDKLEHVKNPVILDFLNLSKNEYHYESEIETAIINNLQKFLMELGKGYAFVGRQYRIQTEENNYFVDLVFYNFILKCFVLVDLKSGKITHQDIGQMDMYVRMFDELVKNNDDNPTLGVVLCFETDKDIARYSILKGHEQLFATKYKLYLPSEEDLKAEIEYQKELYYIQKRESDKN